MTALLDLSGLTALVTGASSGLGERFATVLSGAGAKVALAARRTERLDALRQRIEAAGGRALPVRMDVTDLNSIVEAVKQVETELGPIDILVNNSGVSAPARMVEMSEADYDFVMDTNLKGAFFVAREVAAQMIRHKVKGRIINIASVAAHKYLGQLGVYGMSKAGVVYMTQAMAVEWGRNDINTNCICPGYIETEMNKDHWDTEAGRKLISMLPRRRVGDPSDLDGTILLLASPHSHFINGAVISVDDGLTWT